MLNTLRYHLNLLLLRLLAPLLPGSAHVAFVGAGSSRQLCAHLATLAPRKVLIVTDKPLRDLGVVDQAVAGLVEAAVEVAWFDGVLPDPTYEQVDAGLEILRREGCDVLLAIGGGSAMDCAKVIAVRATRDEDPRKWQGLGKVKHEGLPVYAIPTTAGTGSEGTVGAVVKDSQTLTKTVLSGPSLLPKATALDATLMRGLPPQITAATGMDALTHAIEAYIGVWERGNRKADARAAIQLVFAHLPTAYANGDDLAAREGMALGAYYGGMAINQVFVGSVHALAHQIGGKYGIPHGLANALILPHVLEYCREEAEQALAELALLIGVGRQGDPVAQLSHQFIAAVRDLRTTVGIADTSDVLRPADFDQLAEQAAAECVGYPVPRLLDKAAALDILHTISA